MQLFKRVLLSLFPDDIVGQSVNPASMFISFISPKEFFSVINKKIVENYKLNLFDVTIDPFEFKIGFGENIPIKPKDVDFYFGYCATASLNGYRFFSPANVANSVSLVSSLYVKDIMRKYEPSYYLNFLYAVFLLHFVFLSRIKTFPSTNKEQNYNWLIDVFFSFYEFVFHQTGETVNKQTIQKIKKEILNQSEMFFLLLDMYQHYNTLLTPRTGNDKDFYTRLFYDELKGDSKEVFQNFISNAAKSTQSKTFTPADHKILQHVLPIDILLKYLFIDTDMFLMTDAVVSKIFDKKIIDSFLLKFRKGQPAIEDFLMYITDYRNFKKKFFVGVQKYIITVFKDADQGEIGEDIDDLMSSIGEDVENIDSFKIPERIKKESKLMEKILNFYITMIGGLWVARGDDFFLRLFRKDLIQSILPSKIQDEKDYTLMYYGALLYQYGKNVFYYKYTSDHVRAGKQKFILPNKPNTKNIYSNTHLLRSFDEHFLAVLLQDINPKDIRIYLKHKGILEQFKILLGRQISDLVTGKPATFIKGIYSSMTQHLDAGPKVLAALQKNLSKQDVFHLKENIYNIDFWIAQNFYQELHGSKIILSDHYSDSAIMGIFAGIRETLRGFLLYMSYLQTQRGKQDIHKNLIFHIYLKEVLHIDDYYIPKIIPVINRVTDTFEDIIHLWLSLDDNTEYLRIAAENRSAFVGDKKVAEISKSYSSEDTLWFTGFLKNITYYNKRFLIPK